MNHFTVLVWRKRKRNRGRLVAVLFFLRAMDMVMQIWSRLSGNLKSGRSSYFVRFQLCSTGFSVRGRKREATRR